MMNAKCTKCHKLKPQTEFITPGGKTYKYCESCRGRYARPRVDVVSPINENGREIILSERIDKLKLNYILANHKKYLADVDQKMKNGTIASKNAQLTLLTDYHNKMSDSGELMVKYNQIDNFGRYYSDEKLSLQNLSKKIRHTICEEFTWDLDMVNAHPKLLSFYCHKNDIDCVWLDHYIDNREECIAEVMALTGQSRDEVKADILAILNGRLKYQDKHSDYPDWYKFYFDNVRNIIGSVCHLNQDIYAKALKKRTYNAEGTCINSVMSNLENQALMIAYDYFVRIGIEVCALVYDGLMIYKGFNGSNIIPRILNALNKEIKLKMGADIEWSMKKMDQGFDLTDEVELHKSITLTSYDDSYDTLFFNGGSTPYVNVVDIDQSVKYVQDLDFKDGRCVAISSPLGSGKTSTICRYIQDNNVQRVLVLSPRISFAKSITNEYNERISVGNKFKCYEQLNRLDLPSIDRLVISMESLHYLNYDGKPFDLLVVDECQANLGSHTCVATNGNRIETNFTIFERLLRTSKKMIFADAFFGSKTTQFLTDCQIPTVLYRYLRRMERREAIVIEGDDLDCLLPEIKSSLDRGERNYIFVSSAKRAMTWYIELMKKYPEKQFACYTKGEGKMINDVRKEWGCLDAVITTATITVGINFDVPDYFHNVFMDVSSRAQNLVSDVFQSHYRVRHLINKRLYVHIYDSPIERLATNEQAIVEELEWKESTLISLSPLFSKAPLSIKRLFAYNTLENNLSNCKLTDIMYLFLRFCNYDVKKKNLEENLPIEDLEKIDSSIEFLPFKDISLLSKIDYSELKRKMARGIKLSDYEKMQIEKYHLVDAISSGLFQTWENSQADEIFWKCWIEYKKAKIYNIKTEKQLRTGLLSMEDLVRKETTHCSTAILSSGRNLEISHTIKILDDLGISISQQPNQVIGYDKISKWCDTIRQKHVELRKVFKLRDQRKDKSATLNDKECVDLLNSILKKHGFTKITKKRSKTRDKNGKTIDRPNSDYIIEDYCDVKGLSDDEKEGLGIGIYNHIIIPMKVESKRPPSDPILRLADNYNSS